MADDPTAQPIIAVDINALVRSFPIRGRWLIRLAHHLSFAVPTAER